MREWALLASTSCHPRKHSEQYASGSSPSFVSVLHISHMVNQPPRLSSLARAPQLFSAHARVEVRTLLRSTGCNGPEFDPPPSRTVVKPGRGIFAVELVAILFEPLGDVEDRLSLLRREGLLKRPLRAHFRPLLLAARTAYVRPFRSDHTGSRAAKGAASTAHPAKSFQ